MDPHSLFRPLALAVHNFSVLTPALVCIYRHFPNDFAIGHISSGLVRVFLPIGPEVKDKGLQYKVNDDFFDQASMIQYNKEIYTNVTLIAYIQTDPVTVYRQEMEELAIQKAGIMIELKLLRGN